MVIGLFEENKDPTLAIDSPTLEKIEQFIQKELFQASSPRGAKKRSFFLKSCDEKTL